MKISVVIPAYNEIPTIGKVLDRVSAAPFPDGIISVEIIVIDDCSTDGTREYLQQLSAKKDIVASRIIPAKVL